MRIYEIALAVFLLNISIGMVGGLGVIPDASLSQQEDFADANSTVQNVKGDLESDVQSTEAGSLPEQIALSLGAIGDFASLMLTVPVALPALMAQIGVPPTITTPIGGIIALVYIVGLLEFIRGVKIDE